MNVSLISMTAGEDRIPTTKLFHNPDGVFLDSDTCPDFSQFGRSLVNGHIPMPLTEASGDSKARDAAANNMSITSHHPF